MTLQLALFLLLPILFSVLALWLAKPVQLPKAGLRLFGYVIWGYALLGAYQLGSAYLTKRTEAGKISEETVKLLQSNRAVLEQGKKIFDTRCVTCHGQYGEGVVGPNLTDEYWIYGGSIRDIFRTIRHGIPGTPMTAWKSMLTDEEQQAIANYVYSLYGTNPPNSKPPQGFIYVRTRAK